jgi:hypothetical protein
MQLAAVTFLIFAIFFYLATDNMRGRVGVCDTAKN